ncbi:hypothetical protein GN958_ATG05457 [Phytophthora infestans]|uniref:Uncharacterized protein n=1 Tax=Phytophthora infestans TaxID=4787 RepID=A0A8S9V1V1_PHYIN|nr:hypothetical protein GN958_ATG05457 [Phytophthora infestans]
MSPAKRTGQSSGKVPSTTPPASPSSMSPTDLRVLAQALSDQVQTLTAELQTAQDAQDQAASLHTTQLQTLRAQIHDQAMEIQGGSTVRPLGRRTCDSCWLIRRSRSAT